MIRSSSVSHGSNAPHPTGTWPVIAAHAADVDLHNLGLGGSALLDPFVARTIAGPGGRHHQREARHQPGQRGPDAPPCARPGGPRVPGHDPGRAPGHSPDRDVPGVLSDPGIDPRPVGPGFQ
nr:SGNH/GDSL hydrolase family protein [Corynebacterium variabile]